MDIDGGNTQVSEFLQYQLAINIAEASDTDLTNGVAENANYGIALAAATTDMLPWVNRDGNLVMPYTKGWFDACEPPSLQPRGTE